MGTIYVAGPMTGRHLYNWPAFEAAARMLRRLGWTVHCPTEIDEQEGMVVAVRDEFGTIHDVYTTDKFDYETILQIDLSVVREMDAIFLLNDWHQSSGARRELHTYLSTGRTQILLEAELFTDVKGGAYHA